MLQMLFVHFEIAREAQQRILMSLCRLVYSSSVHVLHLHVLMTRGRNSAAHQ